MAFSRKNDERDVTHERILSHGPVRGQFAFTFGTLDSTASTETTAARFENTATVGTLAVSVDEVTRLLLADYPVTTPVLAIHDERIE